MLQDILSKTSYLFVLAVFLVLPILPMQAMAGFDPIQIIDQTDTGTDRLVSYWDTRTRDTFIQVTNTSASTVAIHVQLFDVLSDVEVCEPCDFPDVLTGHDTHVYNIEDIVRNADGTPRCPIPADRYGSMVISVVPGNHPNRPLIGMFRIIDELGYEYRTNSAGKKVWDGGGSARAIPMIVNFSEANGHVFSDLVGITYVETSADTVQAQGVTATFGGPAGPGDIDEVMIYDEIEGPSSCGTTSFSCAVGQMDKAIDQSLPNSKGEINRICSANTLDFNSAGWVDMPFAGFSCTASAGGNAGGLCDVYQPFFVSFLGLNNGDGTGSMDSWWLSDQDRVVDGG